MGMKTVRHPRYNSDIAPCDFSLLFMLKGENLRVNCFEDIEEMEKSVTKFLDTLILDDFHVGAFREWLNRSNKCSEVRGSYLEVVLYFFFKLVNVFPEKVSNLRKAYRTFS